MIITQTPLRIGLLGGGTDLPGYYREHGGRVLNCALDKYVYVIVKQRFDDDIYVNYSKKEIVSRVEDLEHELVREAMRMTGVTNGVEITTLADIPSAGSGLGSSSAVTVGLLHALFAYQGRQVTAEELAERACMIEIELCGKPIGKQDQYIAAFGGIRDIRFGPGDEVVAEELELSAAAAPDSPAADHALLHGHHPERELRSWPSRTRTSKPPVLSSTSCATSPGLPSSGCAAATWTRSALRCARAGRPSGSWRRECRIDQIDMAVSRALDAGASGAKLTGAGGGGFLLVICPMERQRAVRESLADMQELPVKLDRLGSRVVLNVLRDIWG